MLTWNTKPGRSGSAPDRAISHSFDGAAKEHAFLIIVLDTVDGSCPRDVALECIAMGPHGRTQSDGRLLSDCETSTLVDAERSDQVLLVVLGLIDIKAE